MAARKRSRSSDALVTRAGKPETEKPPPAVKPPPPVAERVAHIADLMSKGRYRTRVTIRKLAKEWGVTEGTLGNDASEAARLLAVPESERAERRATMAAWFAAQAHAALLRKSKITGLPDTAAALKAMELYGKYAVIEPKTEDSAPPPTPPRIVVTFEESPATPIQPMPDAATEKPE